VRHPRDGDEWHRWAVAHLDAVVGRDGRWPGRYPFRAEVRDDPG